MASALIHSHSSLGTKATLKRKEPRDPPSCSFPPPWLLFGQWSSQCCTQPLCTSMGRHSPSRHSSQWESPSGAAEVWLHVLGTRWAHSLAGECRSTCQRLGALSLRGCQTRLPCTHQRGNPCVPPQAAPSWLETLKAALASGVGQVGMGTPPRTPPRNHAEPHQGSPVLLRNISSTLLTSSWGRK